MRRTSIFLLFMVLMAGCGSSAKQPSVTSGVSPQLIPVRPAVPTDLAVAAGDSTASLTWTLPIGSRTYKIEIDRWTTGLLPSPYKSLPPGTTSFSDSGLTNGTTYFYLVVVRDRNGVMSCCSATTAAVPVAPIPIEVAESGDSYSGSSADAAADAAAASLAWYQGTLMTDDEVAEFKRGAQTGNTGPFNP